MIKKRSSENWGKIFGIWGGV